MFLLTGVTLAYLVLPPFFFILHTSLVTDRGLQAGSFTIQHFANIVDSLGDVKTLLTNSMIYSFGSSAVAIWFTAPLLAWLAERSDAPFRTVAYISAYVSFAIPGIIKVVGWIMLLGPKAGMFNSSVASPTPASPCLTSFPCKRHGSGRKLSLDTHRLLVDVDAVSLHGPVPGRSRHHRRQHRLASLSNGHLPAGHAERPGGVDSDDYPFPGSLRDSRADRHSRRRRSVDHENLSANQRRLNS